MGDLKYGASVSVRRKLLWVFDGARWVENAAGEPRQTAGVFAPDSAVSRPMDKNQEPEVYKSQILPTNIPRKFNFHYETLRKYQQKYNILTYQKW